MDGLGSSTLLLSDTSRLWPWKKKQHGHILQYPYSMAILCSAATDFIEILGETMVVLVDLNAETSHLGDLGVAMLQTCEAKPMAQLPGQALAPSSWDWSPSLNTKRFSRWWIEKPFTVKVRCASLGVSRGLEAWHDCLSRIFTFCNFVGVILASCWRVGLVHWSACAFYRDAPGQPLSMAGSSPRNSKKKPRTSACQVVTQLKKIMDIGLKEPGFGVSFFFWKLILQNEVALLVFNS